MSSIWDMVVGHDEAVAMLKEAVASERVTHAWLFTGPPGIGKLHTARVFAAALNCPAGGDGTCDTCRRILRGVHPDVHLVVPEGDNLLVEDVRAVREEASRTHHEARTAVFILDEADRMTEAAANALLKVLEEPPPEVVFVLVVRSAEALVGTVPSRARVLPFVSLSLAELTAALGEDLQLDRDQTAWAAAASHGRLARARALLTEEAARTHRATVLDLTERLATGQPSDALAAAATVVTIADEVAAAARLRQEREVAELEEAFGTGRGTGALRKRLETRHRRELRRVRFDAIRDSLADLLGAYRDIALLAPAGIPGGPARHSDGSRGPQEAPLVHPDKAGTFTRLAAKTDPASALRAAGAIEEADRRLAIGAAPLLTLEAAFLSVQAALRGPAVPINRLAIRR
ncbi:MAG TPA: DNA polymerase III subunit delta' [Actinomycetes bacterium]|nr:DNA polymerase III subunit delta' [Actinomycetes bacterium]